MSRFVAYLVRKDGQEVEVAAGWYDSINAAIGDLRPEALSAADTGQHKEWIVRSAAEDGMIVHRENLPARNTGGDPPWLVDAQRTGGGLPHASWPEGT